MQVKLYLYDPKINSAYYTRKRVGKNTRITNLSLYNLHLLVHQFSLESWIMHRKSTLDFVEKIILAIKTSDTQSSCIGSKYKYVMYVMQAICLHIWHTTYSWNIKWQKCVGMGLNGFISRKINQNQNTKKNPGSCLEVSCIIAQPIQPILTQIGSQVFFRFSIFVYFCKYKTIETHAHAFLLHNISVVGIVYYVT